MYEELQIINKDQIQDISHNSLLNCLFILTKSKNLIIYDCNTRCVLRQLNLSARSNFIKIQNIQEKCLIVGDQTICSRLTYDGVYLIDSVFQRSFNVREDTSKVQVELELTLNDAYILLSVLKSLEIELVHGLEGIVKQIESEFNEKKSNNELWSTVSINDTFNTLFLVLNQSLDELKRTQSQSLGIPILSGLIDRLFRLNLNNIDLMQAMIANFDKRFMASEANRRATFHDWPHMDYKWVLPDTLAQAGFFHQSTQPGDDRTSCFVCNLCLVSWEQTDQPWSEHERHSPMCQFVRGEITENVPLSLTASTQNASAIYKQECVSCTSDNSSERYFAVSDLNGHIVVYDTKDLLKELMHVQLVDDSDHENASKLKIHSLCFYFRNHKHVLYGSFTINDEIFVFSFNIFDIYRSYQSRPNKKSSKSSKSTSTSAASSKQSSKTLKTINTLPTIDDSNSQKESKINNSEEMSLTNYVESMIKTEASKVTQEETSEIDAKPSNTKKIPTFPNFTFSSTNPPNFDLFSLMNEPNALANMTPPSVPPQILPKLDPKKVPSTQNLSNFLIVKFEISPNLEMTSKSKSKYKKSIKIVSVNTKLLTHLVDGQADQVQKAYEFTEKCLSFRLACLDYSMEKREDFKIKLINLFDKSLFALINFKLEDDQDSYKLYQIKHEENPNQAKLTQETTDASSLPPILAATSSSRLNLSEFQIDNLPFNRKFTCLIPISVTTYEEDNDIRLIAILDDHGIIHIIDPVKNSKLTEFQSPSTQDKFTHISYCCGIDKICASSEMGKIYLLCMRVSPIISQNALDEMLFMSDNNNESLISNANFLVDATLKQDVIDSLHNLTYFDTSKISFSARFPSCWTPISPEQNQQRKHPPNMLAEPQNFTKSWKFISNCSSNGSSDELNVEIYLNKPFQIGCIQLKLKFNKELTFPVEIRLYKQKKHPENITNSFGVDNKIDFHLNSKYDILFGPIDARDFLDLSNQRTCIITICSSKLLETQTNLYFLNLKPTGADSSLEYQNLYQKIYITLRKYQKTGLQNERIERNLMLKKANFFIRLLQVLPNEREREQIKIIDMLNWILYNNMSQLNDLKNGILENLDMLIQTCFVNGQRTIAKKASHMLIFFTQSSIDSDRKISLILVEKIMSYLDRLTCFSSSASTYWYFMTLHHLMLLTPSVAFSKCIQTLIDLSQAVKYNPYNSLLKMRFGFTCLPFESQLFDVDLYLKFDLNNVKMSQQQHALKDQVNGTTVTNPLGQAQTQGQQATQGAFSFGTLIDNAITNGFSSIGNTQNDMQATNFLFGSSNGSKNFNGQSNLSIMSKLSAADSLHSKDLFSLVPSIVGLMEVLPLNFKCIASSQGTTIEKTDSKQDLLMCMLPNATSFTSNKTSNETTNGTDKLNDQLFSQLINEYMNKANEMIDILSSNNLSSTLTIMKDNLTNAKKKLSESQSKINELKPSTEPPTPKNTPFPGQTPPNEPQTQIPPVNIDTSIFNSIFSLQSSQFLVIDRMEPVSRHSVTLDFGFDVNLTDILIPACPELASLSVDVWCVKEQKDSRRICVSTDINTNPILLNDLQPVITCRYLKLIMVAYSSNIVKAKIPIGFYFGYPNILHDETHLNNISQHLVYLEKLYEDSQCHFSLSTCKLKKFLNEIKYPNDNIGHLKMNQLMLNNEQNETNLKIKEAYHECLDYQFQMNLNRKMIYRLKESISCVPKNCENTNRPIDQVPQDQIRILNSFLVKTLLSLSFENDKCEIDLNQALILFRNLCIYGNLERECSWLLLRTCYSKSWWGDFISNCLKTYFLGHSKEILPLSQIFITLNEICLKSLNGCQAESLFASIFELIKSILASNESIEVTSLEWILLFLSRLLSVVDKSRDSSGQIDSYSQTSNRWEFLENIYTTYKAQNSKTFALRNKTKLLKSKKKLFQSSKYLSLGNKLKEQRKNWEKYSSRRHLWKNECYPTNDQQKSNVTRKITLPRESSMEVCRLLVKFLINANTFCSSDLYVLTCRILSSLCINSLPCISLNEIIDVTSLSQIVSLCVCAEYNHGSVCWGSPWTQHALISFLMDLIENEKCLAAEEDTLSGNGSEAHGEDEEHDIIVDSKPPLKKNEQPSDNNFSKNFTNLANLFSEQINDESAKQQQPLHQPQTQGSKQANNLSTLFFEPQIMLNKFQPNVNNTLSSNSTQDVKKSNLASKYSLTYDMRLDTSFYQTMEGYLFVKSAVQADLLSRALSEPLSITVKEASSSSSSWMSKNKSNGKLKPLRDQTTSLLEDSLDGIFKQIEMANLENILSFWLALSLSDNTDLSFDSTREPLVQLSDETIVNLIPTLVSYPFMHVKLWYLIFRSLTLHINQVSKKNQVFVLLALNNNLYRLIAKFISFNQELVGDECCVAFVDFLKRLTFFTFGTKHELTVKCNLFRLLCDSLASNGNITQSNGPLDAQISFLEFLNEDSIVKCFDFTKNNEKLLVSFYRYLAVLVHHHLCIYPRLSFKGQTSTRSCFSSVLGIGMNGGHTTTIANNYQDKYKTWSMKPMSSNKTSHINQNSSGTYTRDNLMCLLLKLGINIITRAPSNSVQLKNELMIQEKQQSTEGELYDDLFVQQLFLYELQMEENENLMEEDLDSFNDENLSADEIRYKQMKSKIDSLPSLQEAKTFQQQQQQKLDQIQIDSSKKVLIIQSLSDESLEVFIEALALCQSSALAMIMSSSGLPLDINISEIQTPGDGLFLLLKTLAHVPLKLVGPTYKYLNKNKRLSEPLIWFFQIIFSQHEVLQSFIDLGGIDVLAKNLDSTTRQLLYSGPCVISSVMNQLDIERQSIKLANNQDIDSTEGFTNFAPFSSIMCASQSSSVDVLIQTSVPHRRMRSAVWSYHFQIDEQKVSLHLTFPYAFLLKEIHILPHTITYGNCPGHVSVEVSRDGSFMTPIGPPINTNGMSTIKLQLNKSELVSTVQLNLYRAKDSQMIGLSQIKVLGYPMFENMLSAKPDMMFTPIEDLVSRSNIGWLRLLHMCLTSVPSLEKVVCDKLNDRTIQLCTNLLASPSMIINDKIIETILLKIVKNNPHRNHEITRNLLRVEEGTISKGFYSVPHGVLLETLINVLYQINLSNDSSENIAIILEFIHSFATGIGEMYPSSMILHCLACILYKTKEISMISEEFVSDLIELLGNVKEFYTKQALDWIMCSVLYQKPDFLHILIDKIDLTKLCGSYEAMQGTLKLMETLTYAIQSKNVVEIFLKSAFFTQFIDYFKRIMQESKEIEINAIRLLVALGEYSNGRLWLGTDDGCFIWKSLLTKLCTHKSSSKSEDSCLLMTQLIKKLVFCNIHNQNLFAQHLTLLIKDLSNNVSTNSTLASKSTISGFLHQLILQVLLEDQNVTVNFVRKCDYFKGMCNSSLGLLMHPRFGTGNNVRTIEMPLSKNAQQLVQFITDLPLSQTLSSFNNDKSTEGPLEVNDLLEKFKSNQKQTTKPMPKIRLFCTDLSEDFYIPNDCTLTQILNAYLAKNGITSLENISFDVRVSEDDNEFKEVYELNSKQETYLDANFAHSPLDAFVKCDGLIVLAERLPIVMPFMHEPLLNITDKDRLSTSSKPSEQHANVASGKTTSEFVDYVIMNESDEPFDDEIYDAPQPFVNNQAAPSSSSAHKLKKIAMPPHAFVAFGLFLKIPGYASVLLRNKRQAQCILKLLLGANRNKNEEFGLSLSTMPFNALKELLVDNRFNTKNIELCTFILENKILTLLLTILSSLSHHSHRQVFPHFTQSICTDSTTQVQQTEQENQQLAQNANQTNHTKQNGSNYWAKGTGFGTGSTIQQWDAERTLMQQKLEEEYVTCIMQILSSYLHCFGSEIPELVIELIDHSCVMNTLSSYLRNDSVLDIARHVPLYKASLELFQALVRIPVLCDLIQKCKIIGLLQNMKQFFDSYTSRIKLTDEDGDLTSLVPVVNETCALVNDLIKTKPQDSLCHTQSKISNADEDETQISLDKIYCDTMKELQFDTYAIVSDNNNGSIKVNIPYYYESSLNDLANLNNANRAKRLAQETVTLSNSLPLSFSSSVFVVCDEERLDVMKVLITGPSETPYSNGCFEFDVFFPSDYPDSPPLVNLQTTGNQSVRFNPNLYHDGKVCLSILNTWHGRPEERWNASTSSFLQVLVSIQSLILVQEPYFNEPGYERSRGTAAGTASSFEHDANIRQATVKWAMLEMIKKPTNCFRNVIHKHFLLKRAEIKTQCEQWARELESYLNDKQIGQSVYKSYIALKRNITQLFEELDKLKVDEVEHTNGNDDLDKNFNDNNEMEEKKNI